MTVFIYEFYVDCGQGQGIVIADSKEEAELLLAIDGYEHPQNLILTEVDMTGKHVIDFTWAE